MHRMTLQLCRNRDHLYLKIYLYVFLGFIIGGTFYVMGYDGSKSIYNLGFCFTTVLIFLYIPTLPILLWYVIGFNISLEILSDHWTTHGMAEKFHVLWRFFTNWLYRGSIAYNLASICNITIGVFVGTVIFTILALLAIQNFGITNPLPLHRKLFMYMSYVRYMLEAFLAALCGNGREKLFCPLNEVYCYYSTTKKIFGMLELFLFLLKFMT